MNVKATTETGVFEGEITRTMMAVVASGSTVESAKWHFVSFTAHEMKWDVKRYEKKAIKTGRATLAGIGASRMEDKLFSLEVLSNPDGSLFVIDGDACAEAEREAAFA
jgi:hypothetical protein